MFTLCVLMSTLMVMMAVMYATEQTRRMYLALSFNMLIALRIFGLCSRRRMVRNRFARVKSVSRRAGSPSSSAGTSDL